jgi:hypothetical protein
LSETKDSKEDSQVTGLLNNSAMVALYWAFCTGDRMDTCVHSYAHSSPKGGEAKQVFMREETEGQRGQTGSG